MADKKLYGVFFGPYLYEDDAALDDPDGDFSDMTWDASITDGLHLCAGVRFLDTDQSHHLTLTWNENDSGNRTLQFLVVGGNRSITLNENLVIADGYNFTLQALGQANQLTLNEAFTIGNGSAGTLTFGSVCALTVELASVVNQDLTTDASVTFATVNGLTLAAVAVGFTIAGGSTSKTLTVDDNFVVSTQLAAIGANTSKVTESTTVTAPLVLTTYDISIPAAANDTDGYATAAHITAIEANTAKVTCNFTNVQTALAAASGAVDFNSQNLTGVGTIGCGAITTSGLFTLSNDIKTDRWDGLDTNTFLGIEVCGAGNLDGAAYNTCIGYRSGYNIVGGSNNACIGYGAGGAITSGSSNFAIGTGALGAVVDTHYNCAVGYNALQYTAGSENVGIGALAGQGASGQSFSNNVFIGYQSGRVATTGGTNVCIGRRSAYSLTEGVENVAIGAHAMAYNQAGNYNVYVGRQAGFGASGQSHSNNTFIGYKSGFAITTGGNNICIGYQAGDVITSGADNIIIGHDIDPSAADATNEINIGGTIFGKTDTKRVGINIAVPLAQLHVDQSSTTAAIPVLTLDQADVSEEMIEFITTIGVGNAIEAVNGKTLTTTHFIKVTIPGPLSVYLPVGTIA